MASRSTGQRINDALEKLERCIDVWVATSSAGKQPHLVPLSLAWDGQQVLVATPASTVTARNAAATSAARLAIGDARDVVMIDASVTSVPFEEVAEADVDAYVRRTGWDPRDADGRWVMLRMRPTRVQVWSDEAEITGRTVMTNGAWLA